MSNSITTLFGEMPAGKKKLKFRIIKPVFTTLAVSEVFEVYAEMRFSSPAQIYEQFKFLVKESKEYFYALHLDGKNRISCLDQVSIGSLNQSVVHPREVFKTALLSSAAALILIHNHPTGDPMPSSEDITITRRLNEAGEILGIKILDHIVIGSDSYCSFVERGYL